MGDGYTVDAAWLSNIVGRLGEAATFSLTALEALEETGPIRMGHKDLDKACGHFHDKWQDRAMRFQDEIKNVSAAVAAAQARYETAERMGQQTYQVAPGSGVPAAAVSGQATPSSNITQVLG